MIRAVLFDCFGVLAEAQGNTYRANTPLLSYIARELSPGYTLGVLSNTSLDQFHRLFTNDQLRIFDTLVLSAEVGLAKPDERIYHLAAKRFGVMPEECLFVDDIERYCAAANEAGMRALLYTERQQFERQLEELLQ